MGPTWEPWLGLAHPGVPKLLSPPCDPQVTHIKTIKREDELIEIQSDTGTWYRRWLVRVLNLSQQVGTDPARGVPMSPCHPRGPSSPLVSPCPLVTSLSPRAGVEQLPAVLRARVPAGDADDDGRVVHHVLQVAAGTPGGAARGLGALGGDWDRTGSTGRGLGWDGQPWEGLVALG